MAPSTIPWLTNPDLFLVKEGGVVKVWKCKRTLTSEALMMKPNDFEYVDDVHNHLDLLISMPWLEDDYKELVNYISQRSLLVNGQGLVIAELLLKFGPDGKKIDGPLYMWSLHIIALDTYIQGYRARPIPFRPIQYLDDKKGPGRGNVSVELSPNEHKLTGELKDEKKHKKDLEEEIEKLKEQVKSDKEASDKQIAELKETKETLESGNKAGNQQVTELKESNKTLQSGKEGADKKIIDLQKHLDKHRSGKYGQPWTDNHGNDWFDFYQLQRSSAGVLPIKGSPGEPADGNIYEVTVENTNYFREDKSTNCSPKLFWGVRYRHSGKFLPMKIANIALLGPLDGFGKARFDWRVWRVITIGRGKEGWLVPARSTDGYGRD